MRSIDSIFPPHVVVVDVFQLPQAPSLLVEEEIYVRNSVSKRRNDFTAGRACARAALKRLGEQEVAIPVGKGRQPLWPPGVVGSISHCTGYCAAVVARQEAMPSIGFDVEIGVAMTDELAATINTDRERENFPAKKPAGHLNWDILAFSAKESIYKFHYPLQGTFLGFQDAFVTFEPQAGRFWARLRSDDPDPGSASVRFDGCYAFDDDFVYTSVTSMTGAHASTAVA
jgi:4'-phosphopantetheinyl transferase EntD